MLSVIHSLLEFCIKLMAYNGRRLYHIRSLAARSFFLQLEDQSSCVFFKVQFSLLCTAGVASCCSLALFLLEMSWNCFVRLTLSAFDESSSFDCVVLLKE